MLLIKQDIELIEDIETSNLENKEKVTVIVKISKQLVFKTPKSFIKNSSQKYLNLQRKIPKLLKHGFPILWLLLPFYNKRK